MWRIWSRTHPKPALAKLGYKLYLYEHVGHTESVERNSYTKDLMAEANLSHEEWAAAATQGLPASSRPPKAVLNKPTPKEDPEWLKAFSKAPSQAKRLEKKLGSKVAEGRLTLTRLEAKAKRLAKEGHSATIAKAYQTELNEKMTYLNEQHHNYLKKLALTPATTDSSSSKAHVAELAPRIGWHPSLEGFHHLLRAHRLVRTVTGVWRMGAARMEQFGMG